MFVVMNRLSCAPEYAEHLERAFRQAGSLEGVPGFVDFQFLKDTREGERPAFIALTRWASRAAYEAWTKSESFRASHRGAGHSSPVTASLETYEVLSDG